MKKEEEIFAIICPTQSMYPTKEDIPNDISECELVDCPTCKNKMWLSVKKKLLKELADKNNQKIIHECWACIAERVAQNPEAFKNSKMTRI